MTGTPSTTPSAATPSPRPPPRATGSNLARGRPTTASSTQDASTPASGATDANPATRWSSAFSDPQWLQVDLGRSYALSRVKLSWEAAYGRAYQVQTSLDGASWTTVSSVSDGDGGTDELAVTGTARYVRVQGTARGTAYGYSLLNLTVNGTADLAGTSQLLSQSRPAIASSSESAGTTAAAAVDGKPDTRWSSAFSDPQWVQVDLGAVHSIRRVHLAWETAYAKSFSIQTSRDGSSWTSLYATTTGLGGNQRLDVSGSGRYVRMLGTARSAGYGYSLWEFQVFGS